MRSTATPTDTAPLRSPANARARGANSQWTETYLAQLERHAQKTKAAAGARVTIRTVQKRRAADPDFAARESDAMSVAKDLIESEITRRAIDGVVTVTISKDGKTITTKTEFSDMLLLRLAERLETGSWRQKQQQQQQPGEQNNEFVFATRAERKAALAKMRAEIAEVDAMEGKTHDIDGKKIQKWAG